MERKNSKGSRRRRMKEKMSPLERMRAFSKGEEIDRVVCVPDMGVTMAPFIGAKLSDYYHSAQLMADLEVALFQRLKHDSVGISTSLRGMAEAMGAKIAYPDWNISYLAEPAIHSLRDAENLHIANPLKDGRLPILIEALRLTKEKLGNQVDVGASMTGPFSVAASVVGTENLLKGMIKNPEKVHILMEIITESNNRYIQEVAKLGLGIGFCDPVSSVSVISPKAFREFSLPYLKKNVEEVRKYTGSNPGLHICGRSKEIWEDVLSLGLGSFSIDNEEDLAKGRDIIGEQTVLVGNVPPVDVVFLGNREMIHAGVKEAVEKGKQSKCGYILSTGCQIPMNTPIKNIEYFMEAADIYGKYNAGIF